MVVRPKIPWLDYATFGTIMSVCLGLVVVAWLVITTIDAVPVSKQTAATATFLGLVALFLLGALRLYLVSRFAALRIERQELVLTNELGFQRHLKPARVARIYQVSFYLTVRYPYVMTYFLFLGRDGRTLFKLPAKWWAQEDMEALGKALGVPVNGAMGILSGPAYRSAFPGSISWAVAHPRLAGYVAGPLFVAVLIAILVVISLLQEFLKPHA